MKTVSDAIRKGHYAKKQILCKDWLIAWSHRSRFVTGLKLAQQFSGQRVLDYGCGDGTFLSMLMSEANPPSKATGAELYISSVEDCHTRFNQHANLHFELIGDLNKPEHAQAYDAIICMEVLEHVVGVEPILEQFIRLLTPSGKLLISVPVETGLPLLVKQAARRIAGWRGLGDYPGNSPYTLREYWASVFAGPCQHIVRPIHDDGAGKASHDHKGFNWMALRELLSQQFEIEKIYSSPVSWLSPHLASQVWFLANRKS
jgi:SAM-dependent methyltransferase